MADRGNLLRGRSRVSAQQSAWSFRRSPRTIIGLLASEMTAPGKRPATTCSCAIANRWDARSAPRRQCSTAKASRRHLRPRSGQRAVRTARRRAGDGQRTQAPRAGRSRSSCGSSPTAPTRAKRVASPTRIAFEIPGRAADQVGFQVQKRRWAAERLFAWIVRNRRASRDVDTLVARAEAFRSGASTIGLPRRTWL